MAHNPMVVVGEDRCVAFDEEGPVLHVNGIHGCDPFDEEGPSVAC